MCTALQINYTLCLSPICHRYTVTSALLGSSDWSSVIRSVHVLPIANKSVSILCTSNSCNSHLAQMLISLNSLTGCRMTPCGAKAIAGGLRTNTSLRFLEWVYSVMICHQVILVAMLFSLTDCVTDDDLQHLAEALCTNRTLESLTYVHRVMERYHSVTYWFGRD